MNADSPTYCVNHLTVETHLRCNRCDQYICTKCAVRTPVGYRCRTCIRGQQQVFETATPRDLVIAPLAVFFAGLVIAGILGVIGFWTGLGNFFYSYLILPVLSGAVANVLQQLSSRLTERRRSRNLTILLTVVVAFSALPALLLGLIGGGIYILTLTIIFYYNQNIIRLIS
jgi:hypothetical protein